MRFWSKSQGVDAWWQMRVFAMVGSEIFVGVKQCVSNKERGWQVVSPYGMCLANCADFVRETLCICEFFILTLPFKVTVLTKKRHSRVLLGIHWGFSLTKNVFIGCFSGEVAHLRSARSVWEHLPPCALRWRVVRMGLWCSNAPLAHRRHAYGGMPRPCHAPLAHRRHAG